MSVKEILTDYGITVYQAITVIPVLIGLVGVLLKVVKKPFQLMDVISRNKFILLSVKEKSDAIETIYEDLDGAKKSDIYARELKLAQYGLLYPIYTLRVLFDYLHSINKITDSLYINDFLKHCGIFKRSENSLPVICSRGIISSLGMIVLLLGVSILGFLTGLKGVIEALHSKADWESGAKLIFFTVGEMLFLSMVCIFTTEVYSIYKATKFVKRMINFHDDELYKKFRK